MLVPHNVILISLLRSFLIPWLNLLPPYSSLPTPHSQSKVELRLRVFLHGWGWGRVKNCVLMAGLELWPEGNILSNAKRRSGQKENGVMVSRLWRREGPGGLVEVPRVAVCTCRHTTVRVGRASVHPTSCRGRPSRYRQLGSRSKICKCIFLWYSCLVGFFKRTWMRPVALTTDHTVKSSKATAK